MHHGRCTHRVDFHIMDISGKGTIGQFLAQNRGQSVVKNCFLVLNQLIAYRINGGFSGETSS